MGEWLYRYAAGIDTVPSGAGFHTIYLHPHFDARMGKLSLDYNSPCDTIHSDWSTQNDHVTWKVTFPPNANAVLPLDSVNATLSLLDGKPLASSKVKVESANRILLLSKSYLFIASLAPGAGKED